MAKIDIPVQVNIPVEEVIEYLKKGGTLVEVVRCKDCKYKQGSACEYSAVWVRPNGFCHWGERKEQEDEQIDTNRECKQSHTKSI